MTQLSYMGPRALAMQREPMLHAEICEGLHIPQVVVLWVDRRRLVAGGVKYATISH